MSRRGTILTIVVICAVLGLAIWSGSLIGKAGAKQQETQAQAQLTTASNELDQIKTSYATAQQDNVVLRTQLMSTENAFSQIQSTYGSLQQDNVALRIQMTSTESALSHMKASNASLQESNARLQGDIASLTSELDSLKKRYEALEKTKEFVVDGRLRMSLSTETQFGTITWVRGTVTNAGSTTVSKIYVLVSRYKPDGSLDRLDLPPSIVGSLVPGGTGYFSFIASGETCKVTLLSDY